MSESRHEHTESFEAKHAAIIARTLRWADDAAGRGNWREALRWVDKVRSLGQPLPADYEEKRQVWAKAADRCAMRRPPHASTAAALPADQLGSQS